MQRLHRWFRSRWRKFQNRKRILPPLPRPPSRGVPVQKGDKFSITDFRIWLTADSDGKDPEPAFPIDIPTGADHLHAGASFRVQGPFEAALFNLDGALVRLRPESKAIDVATNSQEDVLFDTAYRLANRTLDVLAAEAFRAPSLKDPLGEHATWFKRDGKNVLRVVSSERIFSHAKLQLEVRDGEGNPRKQPAPQLQWHPSHAYFRQSQGTSDLSDAYRNLFLATEAILSSVYPWEVGDGESRWLHAALQHVVAGYGLKMEDYVSRKGGNPYKRFLREQYSARRCALFHAKLSAGPILPQDPAMRAELSNAVDLLGRLYVDVARNITGARFAGGGVSLHQLDKMAEGMLPKEIYISTSANFNPSALVTTRPALVKHVGGQPTIYSYVGTFERSSLPSGRILRAGGTMEHENELKDGIYFRADIGTEQVDFLEVVFQLEFLNGGALRTWYM